MTEKTGIVFLLTCVSSANLLGFTVGMMLSWSSSVIPKLESTGSENPFEKPITDSDSSWIGSILSVGAVFGPFIASFAAEKIGRKWTLVIFAFPMLIAYLMLAFGLVPWIFYVGRAIAGLTVGGTFATLPTYLAEVSEDSNRGIMGALMNVFVTTGLLLSYLIGPYLSVLIYSVICAGFPCAFIALFGIFMPETPQYLLSKGREVEARSTLQKLRSCTGRVVDEEFESMKVYIKNNSGGSVMELFNTRGNRKALLISVTLALLQQFSGINVVLFYTQTIFKETGSDIPDEFPPMIVGAVMVTASFITPIIVDRLGRRILLITSAIGMLVAETVLGVFFHVKLEGVSWLPIVCMVVYILTYGIGFGPLPWTIMAELFPSNVKAASSCLTASMCWLLSFIITKFFSSISDAIGMGGSFWIFSGFNVVALAFVLFVVPETKGKSAIQIQDILSK